MSRASKLFGNFSVVTFTDTTPILRQPDMSGANYRQHYSMKAKRRKVGNYIMPKRVGIERPSLQNLYFQAAGIHRAVTGFCYSTCAGGSAAPGDKGGNTKRCLEQSPFSGVFTTSYLPGSPRSSIIAQALFDYWRGRSADARGDIRPAVCRDC